MRLNKNMKLARVRITKVSWIAAVLFILGNLGLAQGAFSHQDHDSAQGHISSRGTIELVSGHDGLGAKEYMGEIFQKLNSQHAPPSCKSSRRKIRKAGGGIRNLARWEC
jgi:hypothetical protein